MKKIILNASLITCALLLVFGITSCKKEVKSYTVTFMDGETILKTETVKEGSSAIGLTPTKEGHDFVGWSISVENVTSDITTYAMFTPKTFTVTLTFEAKQADHVEWSDMGSIDFSTGLAKTN